MTSSDLDSLEKDIECLHVYRAKMRDAQKHWNIKQYEDARKEFDKALGKIAENQQLLADTEDKWLSDIQQQLQSSDYPQQIEKFLEENQISFSGRFPDYHIPPFKLSFDLSKNLVKLIMGRKPLQTHSLEPQQLVNWIVQHYRSVLSSRFASEQFCKEILSAYKYLSQSNWRRQISVKDIYQLLTIKKTTKQDYPESNFMFDLARLLQNPTIENEDCYFEFTAHKESKNNYFLTDPQGREKTIGLVSIYPKKSSS